MEKDKRLAFGRIVDRQVKMLKTSEIGQCKYYDRIEHVFLIALESKKSRYNPDGIIYCARESFIVL